MHTFSFWSRPIVFALFWILVAALTLSELTTLVPSLETAGGPSVRTHAAARSRTAPDHVRPRRASDRFAER